MTSRKKTAKGTKKKTTTVKKKTTTTKTKQRKFLADVVPEKCFWINNGPIVKNLEGLLAALKKMKKDTFVHHMNKSKNDFSMWINEVVGDKNLASAIKKAKSNTEAIKVLEKRIKELKR